MENSIYCENDSPSARRVISYSYGTKMLSSKTGPVLSRANSVNARKRCFFEALNSMLWSPK